VIVYIMHGLPGSGKSTLARQLVGPTGLLASADDWHTGADGVYRYDVNKASTAHAWNQKRFRAAVHAQVPRIAVDNTNVLPEHWAPYETVAQDNGYRVEHVWVESGLDDAQLAARTVHSVPVETIGSMRAKMEMSRPR